MPRIGKTVCTNCSMVLDGVSCVHGEEIREKGLKPRRKFGLDEKKLPKPNDVTICIACGHVMAFDENLQLRNLTPAEEIAMAGNPAMLLIQRARGQVIRNHGLDFLQEKSKK